MPYISAMVVQRQSTQQVIARCKAAGLKIVAGGPLFTGEAEQFPEVDHFVLNEAEMTLPRFLQDLAHGMPSPATRRMNSAISPRRLPRAGTWRI